MLYTRVPLRYKVYNNIIYYTYIDAGENLNNIRSCFDVDTIFSLNSNNNNMCTRYMYSKSNIHRIDLLRL